MIGEQFMELMGGVVYFPDSQSNNYSGSEFIKQIYSVDYTTRNNLTIEEFKKGNFPNFYKNFKEIVITDGDDSLTYFVAPNYICIGNDDDYVVLPTTATVAQTLCDITGCVLPTTKMVNDIYNQSECTISPAPIPPDNQMTSTPRFKQHSDKLVKLIGSNKNKLCAGHKKDYVLTNALSPNNPKKKIAIYGWFLNNKPIQGCNSKDHDLNYIDYSQSARLVSKKCILNGSDFPITDIMQDTKYCHLLNDDGILKFLKY